MKTKHNKTAVNNLLKSRLNWIKILLALLFIAITFLIYFIYENQLLNQKIDKASFKQSNYPKFINANKELSCSNPEVENSAPPCPKGTGLFILPRYYPIHTIFLGYEKEITKTGVYQSILNVALKAKPFIKIIFMIPNKQMDNALYEIDPLLNEKTKKNVELLLTPSDYTIWAQDYFELAVDSQTSNLSIIDLPYNPEIGEHIPTAIALACNSNLIVQSELDSNKITKPSGNYGGNIQAITNNLVVIGNNMHPQQKEILEHELQQKLLEIDVKWLSVGHVDELISVVPVKDRKGACPFDILYASPAKALELLNLEGKKQNPEDIELRYGFGDEKKIFSLMSCFNGKGSNEKGCEAILESNNAYARRIENNIKKIRKAITAEDPSCKSVNFLPIPILFTSSKSQNKFGTDEDMAITIDPNPVNNILIDDHIFLPKQNFPVFHNYTKEQMSKYKLKILFFDGKYVHTFGGGIHCSLNVRRSCRPIN